MNQRNPRGLVRPHRPGLCRSQPQCHIWGQRNSRSALLSPGNSLNWPQNSSTSSDRMASLRPPDRPTVKSSSLSITVHKKQLPRSVCVSACPSVGFACFFVCAYVSAVSLCMLWKLGGFFFKSIWQWRLWLHDHGLGYPPVFKCWLWMTLPSHPYHSPPFSFSLMTTSSSAPFASMSTIWKKIKESLRPGLMIQKQILKKTIYKVLWRYSKIWEIPVWISN